MNIKVPEAYHKMRKIHDLRPIPLTHSQINSGMNAIAKPKIKVGAIEAHAGIGPSTILRTHVESPALIMAKISDANL